MVRSYQKPKAGPSVIHIAGTEPGVLDKTQRGRLFRHPNSTFSFANFDPYVANPRDPATDLSRLSLHEERCRPKRIVIENVPGHGSFWRWVPGARKQEGVEDEGSFPRLIELCGQLCVCSQDQWDIYKLDPQYDCYVKFPPALTVIVPKGSVQFTTPLPQMGVSAQGSLLDIQTDEDYDSERMSIDDEGIGPKTRFQRRKPSPREPLRFDFSQVPDSRPEEPKPKRPACALFQSLRSAEEEENDYFAEDVQNRNTRLYEPRNQKRSRTMSPEFGKRAVNAHRIKHETMKRARMRQELEARKALRDREILHSVLSNAHQGSPRFDGNSARSPRGSGNNDSETEESAVDEHEDMIAASVFRMAELNKDRDKERDKERQLGLQDAARLDAQANRNAEAEAKQRRLAKEAEEKKLREQEEEARCQAQRRRQRAEILARVERERELRHEQWNIGTWSVERAIERYRRTSDFFDETKFSKETFPLAFIDIPWPTLRHPLTNRAQDVDWQSTNEFFDSLRLCERDPVYRNLVKRSFRRFHPDWWSSRNLLSCILDEDERNEIQTAVNTVSQALGALYSLA